MGLGLLRLQPGFGFLDPGALVPWCSKKKDNMTKKKEKLLTWAEIDCAALRHNFTVLKNLAQKNYRCQATSDERRVTAPKVLAVVKAGAYGHGMIEVAKTLDKAGADVLGVSNVDEGIALRKAGIKKSILLFENPLPEFASEIVAHKLTPMLCTWELAVALNAAAKRAKRIVEVHIKIDTGMGRMGVWHGEAEKFVRRVSELACLRVCGLATHFPVADTDAAFTRKQIQIFSALVHRLSLTDPRPPTPDPRFYIHAANSAGVAFFKAPFNLVRPGLMLYGLYPNETARRRISLKPVMSVKARVIFVKKIQKGRSVSYGRTFIAKRPMTVATLPIGYSDGYFRRLSNKGMVLIGGQRCSVIGRVTMDQIVVDVSKVKSAKLGAEAVLLGRQGKNEVSAEELAARAGTINYEVVCNLGNRLPRKFCR